ncbi:hypothetical protein BwSG20_52660 [Bradyrhizobium ottawaense]|nr:hypothetical protein BwSG20_52660 [Bradyrhizobium ottawaense]
MKYAFEQSAAVKHVLRLHLGTQLLQLQNVPACNAVHPVECRMARWLLELHDRVTGDVIQLTQEALAQLLAVRRTTVTLTMNKLRGAGCIKPDRRGLLNLKRAQLEGIACECYGVMRSRIDRMCSQELSCEAGGKREVSIWQSEAEGRAATAWHGEEAREERPAGQLWRVDETWPRRGLTDVIDPYRK